MALDVNELVDEIDARYGKKGKKYAKKYAKHAKKLERKLEKRVKHLPVDTPLDRRRRHRGARRAGRGMLVMMVLGAAVAYVVWRKQQEDANFGDAQPTEAGPAPDAFGSAVNGIATPVGAARS
jgi:hypothetical protein